MANFMYTFQLHLKKVAEKRAALFIGKDLKAQANILYGFWNQHYQGHMEEAHGG